MFLTKKKKKYLAWNIGGIWYYIKLLDDLQHDFPAATELITELCAELGISWDAVVAETKVYAIARAYQEDYL